MCGIFGIATKNKNRYKDEDIKKMVDVLFKLSESRGKEAAGLAVKGSKSIDVLKSPLGASSFLRGVSYAKFFDNVLRENREDNFISIIGHSRLVTHGTEDFNNNNQPVIKGNTACVHNGIIANDEELWVKYPELKREYMVDTEVFLDLLNMFFREISSITLVVKKVFEVIEGSASVAVLFNNNYSMLLTTNTGSLYVCTNKEKDTLVFASERYILEEFISRVAGVDVFVKDFIAQIKPGTGILVDPRNLAQKSFNFLATETKEEAGSNFTHQEIKFNDKSNAYEPAILPNGINFPSVVKLTEETKKEMQKSWQRIYEGEGVKRCTKCLLPTTMTFIEFDEQGVCSYCNHHQKIKIKGEEELKKIISKYRKTDGGYDCIVPFSGGRDSTYGLHYIKNVLKMNPIAYTYDWGMLTDIGRRNQARVCGKLGVEHVIVSADIRWKRGNIKRNLEAWLKKPELGMIPLLMAGDKELLHHAEQLKKRTGVRLLVYSYGNGLEDDLFKIGLSGIKLTSALPFQRLPVIDKLRLAKYYFLQYLRNPAYINRSLIDTVFAFYSVFILSDDNVHLFNYIKWDEKELLKTIIDEYKWETEKDTKATWRIDDGTASFYNYIYMTVAGFTEFDTFRSIQVREGILTREEALNLIKEENNPRFESLEWYAKTIGFDPNRAIKIINSTPKLYEKQNRSTAKK